MKTVSKLDFFSDYQLFDKDIAWYHHHNRQGCAVWLSRPKKKTDKMKGKTDQDYYLYSRSCTEKLNYFICTEGIPQYIIFRNLTSILFQAIKIVFKIL